MKLINTVSIERSGEAGYEYYRIPGIVSTDKGTLIVYYEARHGDDWAVIDIYMKRSTDGGKSFGERRMLCSGARKNTTNNPIMIADGGTVHFMCLENYKRLFYSKSEDEGVTWTPLAEITHVLESARPAWPWTCAAVGPGHGTRLQNGRLIASVWLASQPENIIAHSPAKLSTIYSDDHGASWRLGEVFKPENAISPNEACIAQLSDGRVVMNARTQRVNPRERTMPHYRLITVSPDGAGDWSEAIYDKRLPDPQCCAGMCNIPGGILFTNCATYVSRSLCTLRLSRDDLASWTDELMYDPLAGYSDIAYNPVTRTAFAFSEHEAETELRVTEIEL